MRRRLGAQNKGSGAALLRSRCRGGALGGRDVLVLVRSGRYQCRNVETRPDPGTPDRAGQSVSDSGVSGGAGFGFGVRIGV